MTALIWVLLALFLLALVLGYRSEVTQRQMEADDAAAAERDMEALWVELRAQTAESSPRWRDLSSPSQPGQ